MKKLFILFTVIIFSCTTAFAEGLIKNYYAYSVKDINYKTLENELTKLSEQYNTTEVFQPVKNLKHAYYIKWKGSNYFLKLYPAGNNANIFLAADAEYDKNNNDVTQSLNILNLSYEKLHNKYAMQEYKFEFEDAVRAGLLGDFQISPDLVKPLKTGMTKLNNKISKKSKKDSSISYEEDTNPIDLECLETLNHTNSEAQISIQTKEYRLKNKENKYVHAYEYLIKNNANSSMIIEKVSSERLAGLKDITTMTFVDLDRLDLLDTVATFPPVLVCSCGLSIVGSVPNWVRLAKVTKESSRFAKMLPENKTVKAGENLRILVLKFKNDPKPLNFIINRNGEKYNVTF